MRGLVFCFICDFRGWGGRDRTSEWWNQNPLLDWLRELDLNQRPQGYEPDE
jgi:hypothetical protein